METLLGRRRYIPDINAANRQVREAAERMAINMPVQGTSADIIKVAMINLHREMAARKLKSRMLLQVHDELIFEVPDDEMEVMRTLVCRRDGSGGGAFGAAQGGYESGPELGRGKVSN